MIFVLNTRPEPQAHRFAEQVHARFGAEISLIDSPLMTRVFYPLPGRLDTDAEALVLTSETGAEAAARAEAETGRQLPRTAFCVGGRTAEVARAAGFDAISAEGDARDLLRMIAARPERRLLYLHGLDRAADLGAALRPMGFEVTDVVAYRQEPLGLSSVAREALASGAQIVVPLFSPRSSRLFCADLKHFCPDRVWPVVISENARQALDISLMTRAVVAKKPDAAAMLDAIEGCFHLLGVLNLRPPRD